MKIIIEGRFHGLNEFIDANRRVNGRWNAGNDMKRQDQEIIVFQIPRVTLKCPIYIKYHFYEPNKRRDKDNISGYFHKVFQDALVQRGVIPNDTWDNIDGMEDHFSIDAKNPRIEVEIYDAE